jgi:hypothetical protein
MRSRLRSLGVWIVLVAPLVWPAAAAAEGFARSMLATSGKQVDGESTPVRSAAADTDAAGAHGAVSLQPATPSLSGRRILLLGQAAGLPEGTVVVLYCSAYPYAGFVVVGTAAVGEDGSFSFAVSPDRDTRYRARVAGPTAASAELQIDVGGMALRKVKALALGRARVTIVVFHPRDLRWGHARTRWWFASGRHGRFTRTPATRSVRLSGHVAVLVTTVALPAGRFRWRACFHAPGEHALEDPGRPPGCSGRGYAGVGFLPAGFPGPAAIARAERYLRSRGGRTAIAVIDSEGRLSGVNLDEPFITGSVVKAMLLVADLRLLGSFGEHHVDPYSASLLYPMIHVSDNQAASTVGSIVGDTGLYAVAKAARMTDFAVTTDWASARITAADQARFFFAIDSLIPREFVGYARFLLSTIAGYESWGIPQVAKPLGYTVFFKGGWRPSPDVYLVHQIARLEGHGVTFSLAVMTPTATPTCITASTQSKEQRTHYSREPAGRGAAADRRSGKI